MRTFQKDELDRTTFSNHLSNVIRKNKDKSITMGLYGEWGSGKSVVLEMVEKELKETNDITIIRFVPSNIGINADELILKFLELLSEKLRVDGSFDKELSRYIDIYAKLLSSVTIKVSNVNVNLKELFVKPENKSTLIEAKEKISKLIEASTNSLVIIIDEIDRLEHEEIRSILKLVRFIGDFPKTTYLLAFDEKIVSDIINRYYYNDKTKLENNRDFLEKFVQIPVYLPQADPIKSGRMFSDRLKKIIKETEEEIDIKKVENYIVNLNFTPRRIKRLINLTDYYLPLIKDEVNLEDFILLLIIKVQSPELYDYIRSNPYYFLDEKRIKQLDKEEFLLKFNNLQLLLVELFPRLAEIISGEPIEINKGELDLYKRISSVNFFKQYFMYMVPEDEISQAFLDNFFRQVETLDHVESVIQYNDNLKLYSPEKFNRAIATRVEKISPYSREALFQILIKSFDNHFHNFKVCNSIEFALKRLLILFNEAKLNELLNSIGNLKLRLDIITFLETSSFCSESVLKDLQAVLRNNIEENIIVVNEYPEDDKFDLLYFWYENSSELQLSQATKKFINNKNFKEELLFDLFYLPTLAKDKKMELLRYYSDVITNIPREIVINALSGKYGDKNSIELFNYAEETLFDYIQVQLNSVLEIAIEQNIPANLKHQVEKHVYKIIKSEFTSEKKKEILSIGLNNIKNYNDAYQDSKY